MKVTIYIAIACCISFASYSQKNLDIEANNSKVDFLNPQGCIVRYSHGALQGTKHSEDSTGYLGFADVFCKNPYEVIFLYKDLQTRKKMGYNVLSQIFLQKELGKDDYSDFNCFVFVYPHRDPEKQKDVDAMNIDFPVTVLAYKKVGNTWKFVSKTKAATFEKFSEFQFRVLYNFSLGVPHQRPAQKTQSTSGN